MGSDEDSYSQTLRAPRTKRARVNSCDAEALPHRGQAVNEPGETRYPPLSK
jgi:hypothetical protein